MEKRRANEIAASPVMIKVTYNGQPIYIENVNDHKGTAQIYTLNQPGSRQEVPIDNLIEHE